MSETITEHNEPVRREPIGPDTQEDATASPLLSQEVAMLRATSLDDVEPAQSFDPSWAEGPGDER